MEVKKLRAIVREGRLTLDEPTSLPEGTVLDLVVDDEADDLSEEERASLRRAIRKAWTSIKKGEFRPAQEFLDDLRSGSQS